MRDGAEFGRASAPELIPWARHVRWAVENEVLYVLDLRASTYLSMPVSKLANQPDDARRQFEARGLLSSKPPAPSDPSLPRMGTGSGGILSFWSACLWARGVMRRRALADASDTLHGGDAPTSAPVRDLVEQYQSLRPLYPRVASCLFDSLALGRFLLSAGVRSDLRYAVRGGPFAAHAWLEMGGAIINDDPDYCAGFTPMRRP